MRLVDGQIFETNILRVSSVNLDTSLLEFCHDKRYNELFESKKIIFQSPSIELNIAGDNIIMNDSSCQRLSEPECDSVKNKPC